MNGTNLLNNVAKEVEQLHAELDIVKKSTLRRLNVLELFYFLYNFLGTFSEHAIMD